MTPDYVHGYDPRESLRLQDQAATLAELLHSDTVFPAGSRVLEAGCGVGAQTVTLAKNSPGARILAVDISSDSLAEAERAVRAAGLTNVEFQQADILRTSFEPGSFDHVFVCFVLEHLREPEAALKKLRGLLRPGAGPGAAGQPGGTITVIEGDHGSAYFYPASEAAQVAIRCLIELQARGGGDALIGRRLYPLLVAAGFGEVHVSPRMVYADASRPEMVDGFTKKTFTAMVEGVREAAIAEGLATAEAFDQGVADLYRTAEDHGTFCYTFFKANGRV
jgi:ubiquinone/menaquinone biosynthesis C-methylase UbiE